MALPSADFLARSQCIGDAQRISISTTPTNDTIVTAGIWCMLYSTVDARFKMGASGVTVTSTTGSPLTARTYLGPMFFDATVAPRIAVMADSTSGTFEIIPVSA